MVRSERTAQRSSVGRINQHKELFLRRLVDHDDLVVASELVDSERCLSDVLEAGHENAAGEPAVDGGGNGCDRRL